MRSVALLHLHGAELVVGSRDVGARQVGEDRDQEQEGCGGSHAGKLRPNRPSSTAITSDLTSRLPDGRRLLSALALEGPGF